LDTTGDVVCLLAADEDTEKYLLNEEGKNLTYKALKRVIPRLRAACYLSGKRKCETPLALRD